jgi:hypothetical protein
MFTCGAMTGESANTLRPPQSSIASDTNWRPPRVMSGRSEI